MSSVGSCNVMFPFLSSPGASSEAAIEDAVLLRRTRFRDMMQDFDSCTQYVNEGKWW
jgi:hypothetical protein